MSERVLEEVNTYASAQSFEIRLGAFTTQPQHAQELAIT
jgi:hypothetical protein